MHRLLSSEVLWSGLRNSEPSFAGARSQQDDRARYLSSITLGEPGKCPEDAVLLIIVTDNSGSITGGNDPVGRRFDESWLAIARVGARCRCGADMVATLTFDSPTSLDLSPSSITKPHLVEIQNSLAIPPDGAGSSCLGPSLHRAFTLAGKHPDHHVVLVVLSDFLLCDRHPDGVMAKMGEFPGADVHAVVLNASPPPVLVDADSVTVTEVAHGSPVGTVARAVFTALASSRPGAKPKAPEMAGGSKTTSLGRR